MKEKIDVLIKANEARIKTYWQDAANYYQFYLTNFGDDVEVSSQ